LENAMLLDNLRRLTAILFRASGDKVAQSPQAKGPARSALEFDPMWHGDHWQNLLSSPMDARHYVMEDWSLTPGLEFAPTGSAGTRQ
jgi:hypothetical protein